MQGYLFKLPAAFLELFGVLQTPKTTPLPFDRGVEPYRVADELTAIKERDPFSIDPALVERGVRSHAITQNALARHLRSIGIEPCSPEADQPNFDIAWHNGSYFFVAEVKSLTASNEEKQLRLGLGQVLRFAHQIHSAGRTVPVIITERRPTDSGWEDLCNQLGVVPAWPECFSQRFRPVSGDCR